MPAWDFPIIIAAVPVALLVTAWLFRFANPKKRAAAFECDFCGRKQEGIYAREWRFCPYCGTPARPKPHY